MSYIVRADSWDRCAVCLDHNESIQSLKVAGASAVGVMCGDERLMVLVVWGIVPLEEKR